MPLCSPPQLGAISGRRGKCPPSAPAFSLPGSWPLFSSQPQALREPRVSRNREREGCSLPLWRTSPEDPAGAAYHGTMSAPCETDPLPTGWQGRKGKCPPHMPTSGVSSHTNNQFFNFPDTNWVSNNLITFSSDSIWR